MTLPTSAVGYGLMSSSEIAVFWSRKVVCAWDPSQNSVEPFSTLKSHRGILAMK